MVQMQLIECVPNFSDGKDHKVIYAIAETIKKCAGVRLLDVDSGVSTNRTVMTFAGEPAGVFEAAFQAISTACVLIDMRVHKGKHPRMGATDVCPFVPLQNATMEECVLLSNKLGERVGSQLNLPVYLYASAATRADCLSLADIRKGAYEGLVKRFQSNDFAPDFGPGIFNAKSGAIAIGARPLLIAYNINLDSKSEKVASDIAKKIRERGQFKRDSKGAIEKDEQGVPLRIAGALKAVRSIGWYIDEYKKAQISTNLIDLKVTSLHHVFEEVKRQAALHDVIVTGSEIVGLVPLQAMLEAGRYYSQSPDKAPSDQELIRIAIESLGLNDLRLFCPEDKILEYRIKATQLSNNLTQK